MLDLLSSILCRLGCCCHKKPFDPFPISLRYSHYTGHFHRNRYPKMFVSKIPTQHQSLPPMENDFFVPSLKDENKRNGASSLEEDYSSSPVNKKQKLFQQPSAPKVIAPAHVPASKVGIEHYAENDVLSGRGGGTNVHPGNRDFRDLINMYRKTYLQAKKNDKPDISRSIVRKIRENNGRFLKKNEKTGLWIEIGDGK